MIPYFNSTFQDKILLNMLTNSNLLLEQLNFMKNISQLSFQTNYYAPEVNLQNFLAFQQLKFHQILENGLRNSMTSRLNSEPLKILTKTEDIIKFEEVKMPIENKEEDFNHKKLFKSKQQMKILTSTIKRSKTINKKKVNKKRDKKDKRLSQRLKNIIKNYGKRCAYFAISNEGINLISYQLNEDEVLNFKIFIRSNISRITNIFNFREMLLVKQDDTIEISKFKKAFQYVSEIFINNYSTKWIFNSPKIKDVKGHLFARFKILRRVRNPEFFTYIH